MREMSMKKAKMDNHSTRIIMKMMEMVVSQWLSVLWDQESPANRQKMTLNF